MNKSEIVEFFKRDRFAVMIGAKIDSISEDEVVCSLELEEHHLNGADIVQGGVVFTLADFAFAVACNYKDFTEENGKISLNHSCNITFFKPAQGKKLIAKSECIQKGRTLSVYRMVVTDDVGTKVAEFTGNAYAVTKK